MGDYLLELIGAVYLVKNLNITLSPQIWVLARDGKMRDVYCS